MPPSCFRRNPIYPALPSQPFIDDYLLPSDILCLGSDDDNDDERSAQSNRILSKAERYIRGGTLYIHSASLRGPVVRNPWRRLQVQHSTPQPAATPAPSPAMNMKEEKLSTYFAAKKGSVCTPRGKDNSPPRQPPPPPSPPPPPPPPASPDVGVEHVPDSTPPIGWLTKSKDHRLNKTVVDTPSKSKKRRRSATSIRDLEWHHVPSGAVPQLEIDWNKKRPRVNFTAESPAVVTKKVTDERANELHSGEDLKDIDSAALLLQHQLTSSQMRQTIEIAQGVVNSFLKEGDTGLKSLDSPIADAGDRMVGNGKCAPDDAPQVKEEPGAILPSPEAPQVSPIPNTHQPQSVALAPLPSPAPPERFQQPVEPETPWQGTQIQLAAAQKDFFDALADSPLRFGSPNAHPTPNQNSTSKPSKLSTSFLTASSSPGSGDDSMAMWGGVLKTPLLLPQLESHNPSPALEPEKSAPQPHPLPFGSAVSFSSPVRTFENPTGLTPFAAFSTPPRGSARSPEFQSRAVGFSLSSPAPARRSVKFMEIGELDLDSTLEDEPALESSIPSPNKSLMGMGQQGQQGQQGGDEEQDLTREMADIVGSGRWDIDEELRKMAKSVDTTEDKGAKRKRRGGRKILWN